MKRIIAMVFVLSILFCGVTNATLTTIGTATYQGNDYNLIWDDDNNGNSVVWLDYTNAATSWFAQNDWAAGLDLTYTIALEYTVSWDDDAWRLPSVGANPIYGYEQTTSEMGHLFYAELGMQSYPDKNEYTTTAELNASNFDNLIGSWSWYWSGTEHQLPSLAWTFGMGTGFQYFNNKDRTDRLGLAVRSGQVFEVDPVPEPTTLFLLGTGLTGLAAVRRRKKQQ